MQDFKFVIYARIFLHMIIKINLSFREVNRYNFKILKIYYHFDIEPTLHMKYKNKLSFRYKLYINFKL